MSKFNEPTHINTVSQFFVEISQPEEITLDILVEKIRVTGIEWNEHELRLLLHEGTLTPKKKFLILLAVGRIKEPGHAYWILLEYLLQQTVLEEGNGIEDAGIINGWIKRNLQPFEAGMDRSIALKTRSNVKYKFSIHENWYISQQISKSVDSLLNNNYDELIIIACRFLSMANYQVYLNPACQSIIRLVRLGNEECEKYLGKYRRAGFPGVNRLDQILNHLWQKYPDSTGMSSSDIISLLGLYKSA